MVTTRWGHLTASAGAAAAAGHDATTPARSMRPSLGLSATGRLESRGPGRRRFANELKDVLILRDATTADPLYSTLLQDPAVTDLAIKDSGAAIRLVEATSPRILILDLSEAASAGVELVRSLRQNQGTSDIPVFVVSPLGERKCAEFRDAGALDVLRRRDLTPELLGFFVRNLLRGRRPWPHVLGATSSIAGERKATRKNRIHDSAAPAVSMPNHVKETRQ